MRTLMACMLTCIVCTAFADADDEIVWRTDLKAASAAAQPTNKPMLIEFWAVWCPPCKVLDEQVFPSPAVQAALTKVLPVRIDVDKQDSVARQYDITGMPTLVFTDSYGHELFRFTGDISAQTMAQLLNELPADVANINSLMQVVDRDKENFDALANLGRELKNASLFRTSNLYYRRAMRVDSRDDQGRARGDILIAMGHNHLELKEFREAADRFQQYLREYSGGASTPEALLGFGRALLYQNKRAEAKRTFQTLIERYKSGTIHDQAVRLLATLS